MKGEERTLWKVASVETDTPENRMTHELIYLSIVRLIIYTHNPPASSSSSSLYSSLSSSSSSSSSSSYFSFFFSWHIYFIFFTTCIPIHERSSRVILILRSVSFESRRTGGRICSFNDRRLRTSREYMTRF